MRYVAEQFFFGALIEFISLFLSLVFKENKKVSVVIFGIGTLVAGVIAFSPLHSTDSPTTRDKSGSTTYFTGIITHTPSIIEIDTPDRQQSTPTTQHVSVTSTITNIISPEAFVSNYFVLINNRDYEASWSMLSSKFQTNHPFNEYTSFWGTVDKIEILSITIKNEDASQVLIYVEARYIYKTNYTTVAHTTYKLIKNGNSWLFAPN
jgi:hypothetical protein